MVKAADKSCSDEEWTPSSARLPDLRFLFRHVHRQLHELPDRSPGPVAARQRHGGRHPPTASACSREAGRRIVDRPPLLRAGRRLRCCRVPSPPSRPSRTPSVSTWRWAVPPTPCCTCWLQPKETGVDFTMPTSTASPARCPACARWRRRWPTYHRRRASRRRHHGHPRRAQPRRPAPHRSAHRPQQDHGRSAVHLGCDEGPR